MWLGAESYEIGKNPTRHPGVAHRVGPRGGVEPTHLDAQPSEVHPVGAVEQLAEVVRSYQGLKGRRPGAYAPMLKYRGPAGPRYDEHPLRAKPYLLSGVVKIL